MPDIHEGHFGDPPGEEFNLDDIFANNETTPVGTTPVVTTTNPPEPAKVDPEPLLKTSTGTVYNTVDDAVKGIEHKDALITELRQQLLQATNVDPLKKKADPVEDPTLTSYISDPKKYFADLKAAQTEEAVLKVQQRFVNEQLAPFAPILATVVKSQAIDQVVSQVPSFRDFLASTQYKETLENFPLLKQSIQISEAYPERSGDLPQLYRMAYDASAGRNLPKVVQSGPITTPVVQTRPTVSSTPATPPVVTGNVAPPSFGSKEGRKTIIEQQESAGVGSLRF